MDWRSQFKLAQETDDLNLIAELAHDEEERIREAVASNYHTPAAILTELSHDEYRWVRYWVACNPNTPDAVLTDLAKDEDWIVQRCAINAIFDRRRKPSTSKIDPSYSLKH